MNLELLPQLQNYQIALFCLGALCLINLVQSFLTAPFSFVNGEQSPGMPLRGDHRLFSFRVLRTYSNSVESVPTFGFTLVLAILVGVGTALTNWIAVIYLACRIAFWVLYYGGYGKTAGGPRTMSFVVGLLANIALVIAAMISLLT